MMEDNIREEKEIKRRALMSKEELKEADKFLVWYRRSHKDKSNRNLFNKWEEVERYWEGELNDGLDDGDADSNTNIMNSNVEGKVALLSDQNLAIQVDPIEPSDRPFCNRVRILADFIKDKNKMYRKIDVHERRREKFGTGIFRVLWNFDALDELGLPIIEPISPAYVFVDPSITDVYKIQEAKYIIEVCNKSIYSAELKYGKDIADAITPNYDPIFDTFVYDEEIPDEEQYLHMFIWTRYRDKKGNSMLRLVEMSGDGVILSDTKQKLKDIKDEEKIRLFPNDRFPYFFTPDMYREGSIWGKASAELVIPLSDQIDEIDNQILNNARLTGNPIRLVASSSGIDADKITNEAGQVIPTNDMNGTKWEQPPQMPTYITNKRTELMNQDRPIVTRFNDQQIGRSQKGVDTATEALALQQAGNSMIDHKKGLLQETLSEVFEYSIELALLNWDTDMTFRITGKNGEDTFEDFNPSSLNEIPLLMKSNTEFRDAYKEKHKDAKPEDYEYMQVEGETRKVKYDLRVTVGAGMPNNKAYRYNIVKESYKEKAITRREYRKYLIDNLGLNVPEIPESQAEQQELGIFSEETLQQMQQAQQIQQGQSGDIEGLNTNGNVMIGGMNNELARTNS